MLLDWIRDNVTMDSIVGTTREDLLSLQIGFDFIVEVIFCCHHAYWCQAGMTKLGNFYLICFQRHHDTSACSD